MYEAIDTGDAKERLMDVSIDDDAAGLIRDFCKFLSFRLPSALLPDGFMYACELTLYSLNAGRDVHTQKPIRNRLVGYPDAVYALIRMRIPDIADAVFPKGFADGMRDVCKTDY